MPWACCTAATTECLRPPPGGPRHRQGDSVCSRAAGPRTAAAAPCTPAAAMGLTPPIAATCLLRQARTRPSKCKKPSAAVCFLGDGASDEDAYRETVNAAGLWNLPTVFACENNLCSDTASIGLTCVQ